MNRRLTVAAVAALATLGLVGSASAYTGDPINTGTGFVGKGELQTPWGWNNSTLQNKAKDVTFAVESSERAEFDCEWTTGEGTRGQKTHEVTLRRSSSVAAAIAYDARLKNQITGFTLKGAGEAVVTGDAIPALGDACLGNGAGGTVTDVRHLGSSAASLIARHPAHEQITLVDTNLAQ